MSTTLFFSVQDAARELGVSPMDVVWSYSRKNIQGQQIPTAKNYVDSIRFTSDQIVNAVRSGKVYEDRKTHLPFGGSAWPQWFKKVAHSEDRRRLRELVEDSVPKYGKPAALQVFMDAHGFDPTHPGEQYRRYQPVEKSYSVPIKDYKNFLLDSLGGGMATEYTSAVAAFVKDSRCSGMYADGINISSPIEKVLCQHVLDAAEKLLSPSTDSRHMGKGGYLAPSPLIRLCAMTDAERFRLKEDCRTAVKSSLPSVSVRQDFGFIKDQDVRLTLNVPAHQIFHDALIQNVMSMVF